MYFASGETSHPSLYPYLFWGRLIFWASNLKQDSASVFWKCTQEQQVLLSLGWHTSLPELLSPSQFFFPPKNGAQKGKLRTRTDTGEHLQWHLLYPTLLLFHFRNISFIMLRASTGRVQLSAPHRSVSSPEPVLEKTPFRSLDYLSHLYTEPLTELEASFRRSSWSKHVADWNHAFVSHGQPPNRWCGSNATDRSQ